MVNKDSLLFEVLYNTSIRNCHLLMKTVAVGTAYLTDNTATFEAFAVGEDIDGLAVECSVKDGSAGSVVIGVPDKNGRCVKILLYVYIEYSIRIKGKLLIKL